MKDTLSRLSLAALLLAIAAGCGGDGGPDAGGADAFGGASNGSEAGAASAPAMESGSDEVEEYRLTMDAVERWHEAQRNLYRRVESDPEMARDLAGVDLSGASLDDLEEHFSSHPTIRQSIEEAGLDPREFVVILFSLYHASVAHAMEQMGGDGDAAMDVDVHPADLEFVRENEARLQQLQSETDALEPAELEDGYEDYGDDY